MAARLGRGASIIVVTMACGVLTAASVLAQSVPLPTPDPRANTALIEDGETLAPLLALAGERHANLTITGARVTRIRFLGPDEAEVQYSIHLA